MNASREQVHARLLLDIRQHGLTYGRFVSRNLMLYTVLVALSLGLLAGARSWHQWEPFYILAGLTLGCALRDLGWLRKGRNEWPFNERVLDWDKVQRLANGETVT
jgi:predicted signal transduction protein with EAL and GGDEF domain